MRPPLHFRSYSIYPSIHQYINSNYLGRLARNPSRYFERVTPEKQLTSQNLVQLDLSHLRAKGVGYARHQSPLKGVILRCVLYPSR